MLSSCNIHFSYLFSNLANNCVHCKDQRTLIHNVMHQLDHDRYKVSCPRCRPYNQSL